MRQALHGRPPPGQTGLHRGLGPLDDHATRPGLNHAGGQFLALAQVPFRGCALVPGPVEIPREDQRGSLGLWGGTAWGKSVRALRSSNATHTDTVYSRRSLGLDDLEAQSSKKLADWSYTVLCGSYFTS